MERIDGHICLTMVDRLPRAGDAGQLSGRRIIHWPSQCLTLRVRGQCNSLVFFDLQPKQKQNGN